MRIRLLGTGAADGIPGFLGDDEVSRWAREHGGRDVRSRTAALIDGTLKIDLPPDTLMQMHRDGLRAADWSGLFFTHSHEDHFAVAELQYVLYPFTSLEAMPFTIYANATIVGHIKARYPKWPFDVVCTESFRPFHHAGYEVTPVRANHIPDEDCHNLIFSRDGRSMLYASDTGIWPEDTFEFLSGCALDLLVIECTEGNRPTAYAGHLDVDDLVRVVDRLRSSGGLAPYGRVVTTHHAHYGGLRHCDLERILVPEGIEVGYDGLELEV